MSKYVERILQTKEESDKALAPARAEQEKAKLGIAIAELSLQVKTAENTLEAMKNQFPLPVDGIIDAQDNLDFDRRRLSQLKEISVELFGA
jgi:hypothetical protein